MPGKRKRAPSPSSSASSSSNDESSNDGITLLPPKSQQKYLKVWSEFCEWSSRGEDDKSVPKEAVIVRFLDHRFKNGQKPKTLWTKLSMIKAVAGDMSHKKLAYPRAQAFIKKCESERPEVKKAATFTWEDIAALMVIPEPPDFHSLLLQKAYIGVGYYGGLRTSENHSLDVSCLTEEDELGCWIKLLPAKQRGFSKPKLFLIPKGVVLDTLKRYQSQLPSDATALWNTPSLDATGSSIGYKRSRVGINTLGHFTIEAAGHLKKAEPKRYTGHSLRRSSATTMANSGASLSQLMQFFQWKSPSVAQQYIDTSKHLLSKLSKSLSDLGSQPPCPNTVPVPDDPVLSQVPTSLPPMAAPVGGTVNYFCISNIAEHATISIGSLPDTQTVKKPAKKSASRK